jgi:hypothetical protein
LSFNAHWVKFGIVRTGIFSAIAFALRPRSCKKLYFYISIQNCCVFLASVRSTTVRSSLVSSSDPKQPPADDDLFKCLHKLMQTDKIRSSFDLCKFGHVNYDWVCKCIFKLHLFWHFLNALMAYRNLGMWMRHSRMKQ